MYVDAYNFIHTHNKWQEKKGQQKKKKKNVTRHGNNKNEKEQHVHDMQRYRHVDKVSLSLPPPSS